LLRSRAKAWRPLDARCAHGSGIDLVAGRCERLGATAWITEYHIRLLRARFRISRLRKFGRNRPRASRHCKRSSCRDALGFWENRCVSGEAGDSAPWYARATGAAVNIPEDRPAAGIGAKDHYVLRLGLEVRALRQRPPAIGCNEASATA
jgi:hypothetical protein